MSIHIDLFTAYVFIGIIGFISIVFGTTMIIVCRRLKKIRHQLEDTNRLLYFNLKSNMEIRAQTNECQETLTEMQSNVSDLASGLQMKLQREAEAAKKKHFPKPDEVDSIVSTIKDLIEIEFIKRHNQRSPLGGALPDIAERVIATYPDISIDYINDKCIVVMEEFNGGI